MARFYGGLVRASPRLPNTSAAPGIWTLQDALQAKAQGIWPTPVVWTAVVDATFDGDNDGLSGCTVRQIVGGALIVGDPPSATKIRLTVHGGSTQPCTFDKCYVGHRAGAGDLYDAASLTQVTWGGLGGTTAPVGTDVTSDPINFSYDGSSDLVVTFHISGDASNDMGARDSSISNALYYWKAAVDEAATANVSSYDGPASSSLYFVRKIEMAP